MKTFDEIKAAPRVYNVREEPIGLTFCYKFTTGIAATVIASPLELTEERGAVQHVSASPFKRSHILTWNELCELKSLCFYPEEECYQVFPKESEYLHGVGHLSNVMHIWRDVKAKI